MVKKDAPDWGLPWDKETMDAWEAQLRIMSGPALWELFEHLRTDPNPLIEPLRVAFTRWMWPPYRTLVSAYSGWCRVCGDSIKTGDTIAWARGGGVTHINCADDYEWPPQERMFPRFRPPRGGGLRCEDCGGKIRVLDQADRGAVRCIACKRELEEKAAMARQLGR